MRAYVRAGGRVRESAHDGRGWWYVSIFQCSEREREAVSVCLQSAHIRTYRVQTMHRVRVKG